MVLVINFRRVVQMVNPRVKEQDETDGVDIAVIESDYPYHPICNGAIPSL